MNPCKAWSELFFSKDRGRIYHHFMLERRNLVKHLKDCVACTNLLLPIDNDLSDNIDAVNQMSDQEFAELIRELYQISQGLRQITVS